MNARLSLLVLLSLGGASLIGCSDDATTTDSGTDVVTVDTVDVVSDAGNDATPGNDATTDRPATDGAVTDTPATDTPATDAPATDGATSDRPVTDGATSDTPATDVPATDGAVSDVPATDGGMAAACTSTGGTVGSALCCTSTGDFPNNCAVGACGCPPTASHTVMTCQCPSGMCFDGTGCHASSS